MANGYSMRDIILVSVAVLGGAFGIASTLSRVDARRIDAQVENVEQRLDRAADLQRTDVRRQRIRERVDPVDIALALTGDAAAVDRVRQVVEEA